MSGPLPTRIALTDPNAAADINTLNNAIGEGWIPANETWTYASADSPTFTFTIAADVTTKYSAGMKIKLTHGGSTKYFIISKTPTYSAPDTTITVYGGTSYTLAAGAITNPYYSNSFAPYGFPLDSTTWTVITTDTTQRSKASPVGGTWYHSDMGSLTIVLPIGIWKLKISGVSQIASNTTEGHYITLSTANNNESDKELTTLQVVYAGQNSASHFYISKVMNITSKTTYYLNHKVDSGGAGCTMYLRSDIATTIIAAECAYL